MGDGGSRDGRRAWGSVLGLVRADGNGCFGYYKSRESRELRVRVCMGEKDKDFYS